MNDANDEIARQYQRTFGERAPHRASGFVIACAVCGSLVDQDARWDHAKWHAAVEAMVAR